MATAPLPTTDAKVEAQVFWIKYHKEIVALIILVIVAAIGYACYRFYGEQQKNAAAAALAGAKTPQEFQQVIAKYPNTPAGASACLFLADSQRAEKNFAGANTTLQDFISKHPKHELVSSARVSMAANLEAMNRVDDALLMYQSAAASEPKSFTAPLALMSQVRLLKGLKKTDEARRICEKIQAEYPESFWANEAMRELRELKPSISPVTGSGPAGAGGAPALLARPPSAAAPAAPPTAKPPK